LSCSPDVFFNVRDKIVLNLHSLFCRFRHRAVHDALCQFEIYLAQFFLRKAIRPVQQDILHHLACLRRVGQSCSVDHVTYHFLQIFHASFPHSNHLPWDLLASAGRRPEPDQVQGRLGPILPADIVKL
jgi:hypothetical protein